MKDEDVDKDAEASPEPEPEPTEEAAEEAVAEEEAEKSDVSEEPPTEAEPPAEAERPLFAQNWPASPELDRLLLAFERASDPAVKAAAIDLRKRIDPAPLAGILVIIAVGLLVVLAGHYLGKHNPGAPPTVAPASTNAPLQPVPSSR